MDIPPKGRSDVLRGVKTKGCNQRVGQKQQSKFRNTLEEWLKPLKKQSATEASQTQQDVVMVDDDELQSTSAKDCRSVHAISDSDEETQPMTPPDREEDNPVSPASKDSAGSHLHHAPSSNCSRPEEEEAEMRPPRPDASAKHCAKITDYFSGTTSPAFPVRRRKPMKSPETPDVDKEATPPDAVKDDVKWLGTPISELKRMPECGGPLPPLRDVPGKHTVMIRVRAILSFLHFSHLRFTFHISFHN